MQLIMLTSYANLGDRRCSPNPPRCNFDDARSGIDAMRDTVERGDARAVERAAHTLKGSSGNMGAQRMAALCGELQDASVSGDLTHAPELLEGLEVEFGRVRPALEAEVARG